MKLYGLTPVVSFISLAKSAEASPFANATGDLAFAYISELTLEVFCESGLTGSSTYGVHYKYYFKTLKRERPAIKQDANVSRDGEIV